MKHLNLSLLVALILSASSCGTVRTLPVQDSSFVEVRIERAIRIDTAYVQLPVISARVEAQDTVSVLENRFAKSEAVVSGGRLSHSLATKAVREPVLVQTELVYRDSLVWRDRIVEKPVEVERKLTAWERFKLAAGGYACMLALALLTLFFIHIISNLKTFKL